MVATQELQASLRALAVPRGRRATAPRCSSTGGAVAGAPVYAYLGAAFAGSVQSLAMLPLRVGADPETFGLLVLGSADKDRFQITMGTAFLERIAELASAALSRLRPR